MKRLKRAAMAVVCLMMLFAAIPAVKADAAVTKDGVYGGTLTKKSGKEHIKVTISGSKLTMKGRPIYGKNEDGYFDENASVLKSGKRVFKLNKKTKYYKVVKQKNKAIKLAAVKKYAKKYSGKNKDNKFLRVTVKKKKVVAVTIW